MTDNKFKEKREHGNFMLPLGVYNVDLGESENFITAHWHNEIEIVLVRSGEFNLQVNSNFYTCKKDDIVIINSGELHYFSINKNGFSTWNTLVFDISQLNTTILDSCSVNFITPIINKDFEIPVIISKKSEINNNLRNILLKIIQVYYSKYYGFELEIKSLMFNFFAQLFRYNLIQKKENTTLLKELKIEKIKEVLQYIEKNYNGDITINTLAKICHYNESHFMRFFKKHTGNTCTQFIKNYRLEKAANLLTNTNLSITEVALEVGFSNISYFIRSFKNKYKITPKEFKCNN